VTVSFTGEREFDVSIKLNIEALIARIGDDHSDTDDSPNAEIYNRLRALPPQELREEFDAFLPGMLERIEATVGGNRVALEFTAVDIPAVGDTDLARDSTLQLSGASSAPGAFVWRWPADYGSNVLRLAYADSDPVQAVWLRAGEINEPFVPDENALPRSRTDVIWNYLTIGFAHIVPKGLDHILFVLGIFLFSPRLKPVLWQVTAFTVAHTITLGLSSLGIISVPGSIVEPIIALSIVYVGIENVFARELKPWRVLLVFCFGLLHGLGFAGVLSEIGLPAGEFVTALISFNVGVEAGQLAVIFLAMALLGPFRNRSWYRSRMTIPLSLIIAAVGLYWTVERIL
jgi:hydrogenase/urease accessory protein HupE